MYEKHSNVTAEQTTDIEYVNYSSRALDSIRNFHTKFASVNQKGYTPNGEW